MTFWGRQEFARYVDTCVQWEGRVASIVEADRNVPELKTRVIPIEGRFVYCGSTSIYQVTRDHLSWPVAISVSRTGPKTKMVLLYNPAMT
jgi:hypothetical protein